MANMIPCSWCKNNNVIEDIRHHWITVPGENNWKKTQRATDRVIYTCPDCDSVVEIAYRVIVENKVTVIRESKHEQR